MEVVCKPPSLVVAGTMGTIPAGTTDRFRYCLTPCERKDPVHGLAT